MRFITSVPFMATLLASIQCAPGPTPNEDAGLAILHRAAKAARAAQNDDNVPFKVDKKWCMWSPNGGCCLNDVATEAWKLLKVDPPKYEWDDYADEEGVYVSGKEGWDAYIEVLYDFYLMVNKHAPYDGYKYDYKKYIAEHKDPYCVWKWKGDCWFNDMLKYVDGVWDSPYKMSRTVRRQKDEKEWSVYSTSKGVQADFAKWGWDFIQGFSKHGPLDWTFEDVEEDDDKY